MPVSRDLLTVGKPSTGLAKKATVNRSLALRLTGRQVDISLPSILSFSIHPINLSLVPVSLNPSGRAVTLPNFLLW